MRRGERTVNSDGPRERALVPETWTRVRGQRAASDGREADREGAGEGEERAL